MKVRVALGMCLVLLLALPITAGAALPKAKSTLIVPNKSVAGLALGATPAQLKATWGGKTCEFACGFEGTKSGTGGTAPFANVLLEKKGAKLQVWLIALSVGYTSGAGGSSVPDFNSPLAAWKTSKGIGLGSKVSEIEAAYPKAKKEITPGGPLFVLKGRGKSQTSFDTLENRVTSISIESHPGG